MILSHTCFSNLCIFLVAVAASLELAVTSTGATETVHDSPKRTMRRETKEKKHMIIDNAGSLSVDEARTSDEAMVSIKNKAEGRVVDVRSVEATAKRAYAAIIQHSGHVVDKTVRKALQDLDDDRARRIAAAQKEARNIANGVMKSLDDMLHDRARWRHRPRELNSSSLGETKANPDSEKPSVKFEELPRQCDDGWWVQMMKDAMAGATEDELFDKTKVPPIPCKWYEAGWPMAACGRGSFPCLECGSDKNAQCSWKPGGTPGLRPKQPKEEPPQTEDVEELLHFFWAHDMADEAFECKKLCGSDDPVKVLRESKLFKGKECYPKEKVEDDSLWAKQSGKTDVGAMPWECDLGFLESFNCKKVEEKDVRTAGGSEEQPAS